MKTFGVFVALLTASGLLAQNHSGASAAGHSGFGSRAPVNGGFYNPARGYIGTRPGSSGYRNGTGVAVPYAYPVAVPAYGYGYGYGYGSGYAGPLFCGNDPFCYDSTYYAGDANYGAAAPPANYAAPAQQQPTTVVVIAPPAAAYGMPPAGQPAMQPPVQPGMSGAQPATAEAETPSHYFIAFKDHSIYTAVAYWVDGDTLHYFTSGNTHNQASVALVDRELTRRLNEESGLEVKLPPAK